MERPLCDDSTDSTLQYKLGPYMASCGLIARLNLDLWLSQAWGELKRDFDYVLPRINFVEFSFVIGERTQSESNWAVSTAAYHVL